MEPDEKPNSYSGESTDANLKKEDDGLVSSSKDNIPKVAHLPQNNVQAQSSKYGHPVYAAISRNNGIINKMSVEAIQVKLKELCLHTGGSKEVLKSRLKAHIKQSELARANIDITENDTPIDYYIVVDLEATCEEERPDGFLHEIIEFPALLLNAKTLKVESEFWTYCRPKFNPTLSKFCTQLTGIQQHQVDVAPTFPVVLSRFKIWLEQNLTPDTTFTLATDGPWDINRFVQAQCKALDIELPYYFKKWVNVRKHFNNFYKVKQVNLEEMLEHLGMRFEGRQHRGIDDSRNIARILSQLIRDGCDVKINDFLKKDFK